jgi:polysaccharide export outer membrane protein
MLDELKREIDARYAELLNGHGIEVTPVLSQRAPRFIYVLGEVTNSGRFDMVGPTNVMQAIALAGGWQNGGNLRHIIVFRRADDWRLMATKIDIRGSLYGKRPIPTDNIWLRDSDVVLVTKQPIKTVADGIDLIFTQGIYAVLPILGDANLFVDGNN